MRLAEQFGSANVANVTVPVCMAGLPVAVDLLPFQTSVPFADMLVFDALTLNPITSDVCVLDTGTPVNVTVPEYVVLLLHVAPSDPEYFNAAPLLSHKTKNLSALPDS